MKKKNLKSLTHTRTIVSSLEKEKIKGGMTSWIEFTVCCRVNKH